MELIICIKINLALKKYKGWHAMEPNNPQPIQLNITYLFTTILKIRQFYF